MSTQQLQQYIFKAGFSTAESYLRLRAWGGHGCCADEHREDRGSVELASIEGKGSVFTIKIPLTLAIVSALIVESGSERFAIPQLSVRELVMISAQGDNRIEYVHNAPVFRLRERLLPLISLNEILRLNEDSPSASAERRTRGYIVVTQVGSYEFGIIVDRVFDTEEIVVKPVCKLLQGLTLFLATPFWAMAA